MAAFGHKQAVKNTQGLRPDLFSILAAITRCFVTFCQLVDYNYLYSIERT